MVCSRDAGRHGLSRQGERVCPQDTSHEGLALGGTAARDPEHPPALA